NPFKKLASQTAIYGLPTIIGRLLNYLLVPLYTYNFSTEEYGTVNVMYSYVSFLLIILTYGMETALFNFSRKSEQKEMTYGTILICVSITSLLFTTGSWVFSQPVADMIRYPGHPEYITWFGMILGLDAVSSIAFAKLREQQKPKAFAVFKTLNIAVNIFFNLFFIVYCKNEYASSGRGSWVEAFYSPEVGVGYIFISNVIASAVTLLALLPSMLQVKIMFDRRHLGTVIRYALPLLVAGLAGMTNETVDRILLQYLLPEDVALSQVGIYGACYKIAVIMIIFIQTFRYAAEPFFFSHAGENDAKAVYSRVMNYFTIVCMVIFLGTTLNISWIQYFVGEDYRAALAVVPILLIAKFCLGVFLNLSIWYKLTGKTLWGAYLTILGAVITVIGNFIFIPVYGYMASAWTTLVCYAAMMIVSYFIGNKHYPVNYDLKRFFGYVTLSLILYALSGYIEAGSIILDVLLKNLLILFFVIVVFVFERKNLSKPV
ncbi:MAG: oligosaccharide flippase family protein, partial [Phycisphaeraceae bacterium]|nr:oligosaccharide flippase family protein [Phycisphaeraceae bacterium]